MIQDPVPLLRYIDVYVYSIANVLLSIRLLQAFKKRWFVLRYSEADGSFILEYYKVFYLWLYRANVESL